MTKIILSLGSSLGNRKEILFSALEQINDKIGKISKISSIYETEPWGFDDKNMFFNMAISLYSSLKPRQILNIIHQIENSHGRMHNKAGIYQARTLDIDIIFYGNKFHFEEDLKIPHIHAHKRKFVLIPILEIEPHFVHPLLQQPIKTLLEKCPDQTNIVKIND